jgi:glycosyltransferase involved in cell wall biosynthesis
MENHFDAVIVQYVFMSKALESIPAGIIRIIDTHDILANRQKIYEKDGLRPAFFYTTRRQESMGLNRADLVLASSAQEQEYFQATVSKRAKVVKVGTMIPIVDEGGLRHQAESDRIAFVGARNPINLQALTYFFHQVWPRLNTPARRYSLDIVGGVGELLNQVPQGCNVLGRVADVAEHYKVADVIINPVQECTGTQTKNLEAFGYGKPLVTTSNGARGFEQGRNKAFLTGDSPKEFADRIESLFADAALYQSVSKLAYQFAGKHNQESMQVLLDAVAR